MDSSYTYRILLMLFIVAVNAFFSGTETALVSVRLSRLRQLADERTVGAQAALSLLSNPERLLSVVQVGLTVCSLALGWVGEETLFSLFASLLGPLLTPATAVVLHGACLALAFAVMTFVHVVLGEVIPKNLALDRADRLALTVAPVMLVFARLIGPFVWTIEHAASSVSRLLGVRGKALSNPHSIEEVRFVLGAMETARNITAFERTSVENVLDLRTLQIREVMVPRNALTMLPVTASFESVLQVFVESRHSRLPVYEGTPDNVLGIVHVKDMLAYCRTRLSLPARLNLLPPFDLRPYVREMPYVPETKSLDQHLEEMRGGHAIVSFVVDEYGTVAGMIAADDVLEQVFGHIHDEFDPLQVKLEISGPFEVEGTIPLRDLETGYGIELPVEAEYETLAGFLLYRLSRIPKAGASVEYGAHTFEVIRMEHNRIAAVRIAPLEARPSDPEDDAG
jgi:CBS domain containing-hemolysin-like protein